MGLMDDISDNAANEADKSLAEQKQKLQQKQQEDKKKQEQQKPDANIDKYESG